MNDAEKLYSAFDNLSKKKDVLSASQAMNVFDKLSKAKHINFEYLKDGCFARAHLMCEWLFDKGLTPKKAWAFQGKEMLKVKFNHVSFKWGYHVAVALDVEFENKKIENMIFDPGLFDAPVAVKTWRRLIGAHLNRIEVVPWKASPKGYSGDYTPTSNTNWKTTNKALDLMAEYSEKFKVKGKRKKMRSNFYLLRERAALIAEVNAGQHDLKINL